MKISIGLVLAAIAITTTHAVNLATADHVINEPAPDYDGFAADSKTSTADPFCSFKCHAVIDRVTDEEGNTYSNGCMMRKAKCREKKMADGDSDLFEELHRGRKNFSPTIYRPSESAKTREQERDEESDGINTSEQSDTSSETSDVSRGFMPDPGEGPGKGRVYTLCPDACSQVNNPATDDIGNVYLNECMMVKVMCRQREPTDIGMGFEHLGLLPDLAPRIRKDRKSAKKETDKDEDDDGSGSSEDEDGDGSDSSEDNDSSSASNEVVQDDDEASNDDGSGEDTPKKSYCPNVLCPEVYSPVTGKGGKVYSNACFRDAAECEGPREDPLDEYKRVYGKEVWSRP